MKKVKEMAKLWAEVYIPWINSVYDLNVVQGWTDDKKDQVHKLILKGMLSKQHTCTEVLAELATMLEITRKGSTGGKGKEKAIIHFVFQSSPVSKGNLFNYSTLFAATNNVTHYAVTSKSPAPLKWSSSSSWHRMWANSNLFAPSIVPNVDVVQSKKGKKKLLYFTQQVPLALWMELVTLFWTNLEKHFLNLDNMAQDDMGKTLERLLQDKDFLRYTMSTWCAPIDSLLAKSSNLLDKKVTNIPSSPTAPNPLIVSKSNFHPVIKIALCRILLVVVATSRNEALNYLDLEAKVEGGEGGSGGRITDEETPSDRDMSNDGDEGKGDKGEGDQEEDDQGEGDRGAGEGWG
ncbi:hypothetical protein M427DRAFT_39729 [Gonapodya prolifera JEL478]|uniref:Uncharacterized protein n=1 Tax=Gonapodya prolifera (strain JEL478) TaxID=1344416 RepID=A0A138ZX14_GONPJ|nr:hypothetical protein M427DRAFT_39729 [Gonapodya prolifera JEL478]|eukprot:KXS09004.1 hypothetical protein M427DRAFT_39729 [Gonapodya prolifera JEL478]